MPRWYEIRAPRNAAGDGQALAAEVYLYDEIGLWGTTAADFANDLRALGPLKDITVRINSAGGEVFAGIAIYNLLKSNGATITVIVDGWAASIASVVAMAGDKVIMPGNAMMMVHNPAWGCCGEEDDFRAVADALAQIKTSIVACYRAKTGLPDQQIEELMSATTFMTAEDAKTLGFCDEVAALVEATNLAKPNLSRFAQVPEAISSKLRPSPTARVPSANPGGLMPPVTPTVAAPAAAAATPAAPAPAAAPPATAAATTEAEMRAQLAAEADARVTGAAPPGETPEAMATRLRAEAAEITDLCAIGGKPKAAAGYIRAGKSPAVVRAELVNRDALAAERAPITAVTTQETTEQSAAAVAASWDAITAKANAMAGFTKKGA